MQISGSTFCADRVRQYKEIVGLLEIHKLLAGKNIPISDVGSLTVWKCRDFPNIRVPELDFDDQTHMHLYRRDW